jgi:hypothetical protein
MNADTLSGWQGPAGAAQRVAQPLRDPRHPGCRVATPLQGQRAAALATAEANTHQRTRHARPARAAARHFPLPHALQPAIGLPVGTADRRNRLDLKQPKA